MLLLAFGLLLQLGGHLGGVDRNAGELGMLRWMPLDHQAVLRIGNCLSDRASVFDGNRDHLARELGWKPRHAIRSYGAVVGMPRATSL